VKPKGGCIMALATDLFKSKKQLLYDYIKQKGYAKTSEIIYDWGRQNFTTRADRYARDLAAEGKIRRMPEQKKIRLFGNIHEEVWELFPHFNPPNIGQ